MITPFRDGEEELPLSVIANRRKVHPGTVRRWRRTGAPNRLDATRVGGRWYVTRDAWDRFVEGCTSGTREPDQPRSAAQRKRDVEAAVRRCIELGA